MPPATAAPTTVAIGQASVATIASTVVPVSTVANGISKQTKTTTAPSSTSTSSTTTTTAAPVAPQPPAVDTGTSKVVVDGTTEDATVSRENNQLVVTAGETTVHLTSLNDNGSIAPLDSDGNLRIDNGGSVRVSVDGFAAESDVDVWMFSTPTLLGRAKVDSSGNLSKAFPLPALIESGKHRLVMKGTNGAGKEQTIAVGLVVGGETKSSRINVLAISSAIALAIFGALFLPAVLRRRRDDQQ